MSIRPHKLNEKLLIPHFIPGSLPESHWKRKWVDLPVSPSTHTHTHTHTLINGKVFGSILRVSPEFCRHWVTDHRKWNVCGSGIRNSSFPCSHPQQKLASDCLALAVLFIYLFICLFVYLWLCWVFVSVRGLSLVVASGGHSSSRCAGLSLSRPPLLQSTSSRRSGSVVVAHGLSCSAACGIFPDQGSNPCPLH